MKQIALFALALAMLPLQAFVVTQGGRPAARIVISRDCARPVVHAADELKTWVSEISGAVLPVWEDAAGISRRIHLTCSPDILAKYPSDAAALKGTEGYAVRLDGDDLYVFADCPKGVLNGVFQLLYRNTDIIWARPDMAIGTIFTKKADLDFTATSWLDIPKFTMRGWQTRYGTSNWELLWAVRNRANWTNFSTGTSPVNKEYGMFREAYFGHNVSGMYIRPDKYYKDHPDFYPFMNGRRVTLEYAKVHRTQLCFSNPEMIKCFIEEFDRHVAARPGERMYGVFAEDNFDQCHCERCDADIQLPDGKILRKNAPNFYSTRFFLFLNQIAAHAKNKYPGVLVSTYAYFFTEIPPAIPVADNIVINTCPIGKDVKFPMTHPANKATYDKLAGWLKKTNKFILYDYFGLTRPFPRPADVAVAADYRFMLEHGITMSHSEIMSDNPNRTDPEKDLAIMTWDCNSLYYWVMSQLAWDPYQDVQKLRREYLERVFGPAADDVAEYLSYTEKAWRSSPEPSRWNTSPGQSWVSLDNLGLLRKSHDAIDRAYTRGLDGKRLKMLDRLAISLRQNPILKLRKKLAGCLDDFRRQPEKYANLVKNPGFETLKAEKSAGLDWSGSPFQHWSFWREHAVGAYGLETSHPASGANAAYFRNTPHAFFIQRFPVKAGQVYFLRCKVRASHGGERIQLTARWQTAKSKWTCVDYNQDFFAAKPAAGQWQTCEGVVIVPEGAEQLVYQMGSLSCKETLEFDDAELYLLKE